METRGQLQVAGKEVALLYGSAKGAHTGWCANSGRGLRRSVPPEENKVLIDLIKDGVPDWKYSAGRDFFYSR